MPYMHLCAVTGLPGHPYFIFRRLLQREIQQIAFKLVFPTHDTNSLFEEAKAYLISFITYYELLVYYNQHDDYVQVIKETLQFKDPFYTRCISVPVSL